VTKVLNVGDVETDHPEGNLLVKMPIELINSLKLGLLDNGFPTYVVEFKVKLGVQPLLAE
jgi:hypothetical protein